MGKTIKKLLYMLYQLTTCFTKLQLNVQVILTNIYHLLCQISSQEQSCSQKIWQQQWHRHNQSMFGCCYRLKFGKKIINGFWLLLINMTSNFMMPSNHISQYIVQDMKGKLRKIRMHRSCFHRSLVRKKSQIWLQIS